MVTRSGELTSGQQFPAASQSQSSRGANPTNQSRKLPSSSSVAVYATTGNSMKCSAHDYTPLIIDATNVNHSKATNTSSVCSVVDSIIGKKSECVEVVCELDNYILKVPGRKRRPADKLASQSMKGKTSDTPTACKHKKKHSQHNDKPAARIHTQNCSQQEDTPAVCKHTQKCSQHEDDNCSVITLGSDDEVEIIYSDPKLELDCSSASDVVNRPCTRKPEIFVDLYTPSHNLKSPILTQEYVNHEDEKMRSRYKYKFKEPAFKEYVSVLGSGFCTSHSRPHDMPFFTSHTACQGIVPFVSPASPSSASDQPVNPGVEKIQDCEITFISSGKGDNQLGLASGPSSSVFGNNLYNPHPDTVRMGLRPIVIDGSNVAMGHTNGKTFSWRGLQICIEYFLKHKHRVVAFVPRFRRMCHSQDTSIPDYLEKQGLVSFTPSRKIGNQLVVPYDDRYIVQYAAECGGVIVSTDNYRDLLEENPAWRETIEKRLLMFTWVGDVLMFPQDPLGRSGPNLESFLRFPLRSY